MIYLFITEEDNNRLPFKTIEIPQKSYCISADNGNYNVGKTEGKNKEFLEEYFKAKNQFPVFLYIGGDVHEEKDEDFLFVLEEQGIKCEVGKYRSEGWRLTEYGSLPIDSPLFTLQINNFDQLRYSLNYTWGYAACNDLYIISFQPVISAKDNKLMIDMKNKYTFLCVDDDAEHIYFHTNEFVEVNNLIKEFPDSIKVNQINDELIE